MRTLIHFGLLMWITVIFGLAVPLSGQVSGTLHDSPAALNERHTGDNCALDSESFPLKERDLSVIKSDGGILFTAGMTIDADGAPNAYGPHNRGLDYTANAKGAHGWAALVTNEKGRPVIQKSGPYRGYYVSTTSLQQVNAGDERSPKRYVDATKIPYIALPQDFARTFDIKLGDLAVVVNQANGRSAYAIYADVGPKGRIGEGSIALAKALGIPANPRHDSAVDGIAYLIFPGSGQDNGGITARRVKSTAARIYHRWGGAQRLRTCDLLVADSKN
jgi:Fungal chitosanase of glycosyl hydrolase group 75